MHTYKRNFVRADELEVIYQAITNQANVIVSAPIGVGKTVLLRNLYNRCVEDDTIIPIYCPCLSDESIACSLIRIEQAIFAQGQPRIQLGGLKGFLLRKIERSLKVAKWGNSQDTVLPTGEKQFYAISLLQRNIDPIENGTYRINSSEAESDFSATLNNVADFLDSSQCLLLIVDSDYALNFDLLRMLFSNIRAMNKIRIVVATDCINSYDIDSIDKKLKLCTLDYFSQDQIKYIISQCGRENPSVLTQRLWERFNGHPLLSDAVLQLLYENPDCSIDDIPESISDQYDYLSARLHSQAPETLKVISELLSILPQGGNLQEIASITGIAPDKVIEVSEASPLINIISFTGDPLNVWLDVYHPLFRKQVISFMSAERKSRLDQRAGDFYLQLLQTKGPIIASSMAVFIPELFRGSDGYLFVNAVIHTLLLSVLVGDLDDTKMYLLKALEICRKADLPQEATVLNGLSILSLEEKDLNDAVLFSTQALDSVRRRQPRQRFLENTILSNLACLLQLQGKLKEALHYALEALSVSQRLYLEYGYQESLSASLSNIGLLYEKIGSFENSLKYYKSALEVDRRTNNIVGIVIDLRRIGTTLQEIGQVDTAIRIHLEALEIDKALGDLQGIASDYGNLGVAYYLKNDSEQSISFLREAFSLFNKIGAKEQALQVQGLIDEINSNSSINNPSDLRD
jgi:tetratricopeptide (TPR) repeat protein